MQSIQNRRRARVLAVTVAIGGAVAAVTVAGVMSASAADQPAGHQSTQQAARPAAAAPQAKSDGALGTVVSTGIRVPGGELVVYAVPVNLAQAPTGKRAVAVHDRLHGPGQVPDVHFGVMMGRRSATGLTPLVETNEVTGSDRSPGFHAVEAAMTVNGVAVPEFGYYAGPAVKITASVNGHQVQARQAAWSQDPSVVFFWFDPAQVPAGAQPTGLAAYDRAGHQLPAGNPSPGQG